MRLSLLEDAKARTGAFRWNGPIPRESLQEWVADRGYVIPESLLKVWEQLGGGELFESETLFEPRTTSEDDIDDENEQLIALGLPFDLLAFHRGLSVSAVDQSSGEIVELDRSTFKERRRFTNFEQWYVNVLRDEYRERYGLRPP
jgi:hypothetical protein